MMSRTQIFRVLNISCLLWVLLLPSRVPALEVPALTARVNDYAAILSPSTVQQLEGALKAFETDQSTQIVVLTIPSLEGEVLEELSIRVAEQWKIGHQGLDNGAILLIARNERKLRIEVGYGLEGRLTDLISGRIIREVIVPRFKQGNFDQGVIDGVSAIMAAVRGEFSAADIQRPAQQPADTEGFLIMLAAIIFFIGKVFGRSRPLAATIGGVAAPLLGLLILGGKWLIIAALIPVGIIGGLIASVFAASAGSARSFRRSGHYLGGGGFGGMGGSRGGFGGGFGGGGGGFGGGGASGGW
jgi:uncharacterized protein